MAVRLFDYMGPGTDPARALRNAADDCAGHGGDTIMMPPEAIVVNETFTLPASVSLVIPRGGQINAVGTLTILGRVTSEALEPFAGNVAGG